MVILITLIAAVICSVVEIFFNLEERNTKNIIKVVLLNIASVLPFTFAILLYVFKFEHFIDSSSYGKIDYILVLLVGILVGILTQTVLALLRGRLVFDKADEIKHKHLRRLVILVACACVFFGVFAAVGTSWGKEAFGDVTGDQLIINLTSPTEGTEASVYTSGIEGPVLLSVFALVAFGIVLLTRFKLVYIYKNERITVLKDSLKKILCLLFSFLVLLYGVRIGVRGFKLKDVFKSYFLKSNFIEENYVDPLEAKIEFPEKKRNLIHIYLESMENSYLSKELGGYLNENIIPELADLGHEGTVFSDTDNYFGGPQQGTGTQWSLASMVNQLTGLPMKAPGLHNSYGADGSFLPGANTLGELLESLGYEQTCMIGASAKFGGLDYLYSTHGNWKMMDYNYAKKNNLIPSDYKVWWGFEDEKLFEFAKDEITRLYKTGKPFNFTMETADTHRPGGYISPGSDTPYKSHYANALYNSSKDVYEFVKWIQKQPFYENTTIVLIGDHLSMDTEFFEEYKFDSSYHRTQYNVIINPAPGVATKDYNITNNRLWSNWDYFPTIVASIGGKIEGERLGIGTNLFSGKKTVYEEYGLNYVNKELQKGSDFYNTHILGVENLKDALSKKK